MRSKGGRLSARLTSIPAAWARQEKVDLGSWQYLKPERIRIPAVFDLERGIWFHIQEGISGILVHDEYQQPHAYMLTQAASHFHHVMTRHDRIPVFLGEQI